MQLKTGLPRPRWSGTHTGLIASFKCAHVPRSSGLDSRSLHRCRAADAQHIAPSVSSSDVQPSTSSVLDSPGVTEAPVPTFEQLGVDRMFLPALSAMGINEPAPIQEAAIPAILRGANCAVQSYTGSGKTLAYLLPVMHITLQRAEQAFKAAGRKSDGVGIQALIVAPSQELCMQIVRVAQGLLPDEARSAVQQCIGGANILRQMDAIAKNKPLVVVGTPGRLAQLVKSAALQLHGCPLLVMDEADQLLGANFREDIVHICQHAGKRVQGGRQTILVSATLSETVLTKFKQWCPEPMYITAGSTAPALAPRINGSDTQQGGDERDVAAPEWGWGSKGWEGPASTVAPRTEGTMGGAEGAELVPTLPPNLRHLYMVTNERDKVDCVRRCVHALDIGRALVFMNWQQRLKDAQHKLEAKGMEVAILHGELDKLQRQNCLEGFRRGAYRVLIVNDVAARGLDLPDLDAVINLELPSNAAHYAHRAGRTARMGAAGMVVSIITHKERFVMDRMALRLGCPIMEAHVSHGRLELGPPPLMTSSSSSSSKNKKTKLVTSGSQSSSSGQATRSSSTVDAVRPKQQPSSGNRASSSGRAETAGIVGKDDSDDDDDDDDVDDGLSAQDLEKQVRAVIRNKPLSDELRQELEELKLEQRRTARRSRRPAQATSIP